ncbi:MAG: family 20 glycosylhydrolase [Melioribacteraceae bacterium]|nr:family 20 glycosylhydrolase [Melioribacteraceae bacterium]
MKYLKTLLLILPLLIFTNCSEEEKIMINIIPNPDEITPRQGYIQLTDQIVFSKNETSKELNYVISYLGERLKSAANIDLVREGTVEFEGSAKLILSISPEVKNEEGYKLEIDNEIKLSAKTPTGLFYGIQSFLQLLPAQIYSNTIAKNVNWVLPKVVIEDSPRFSYRGMHLDVCRHFFPVEFIKKYIDFLAMHKMNTFHWHLTEDQGWRIEIKKYPKLTEIGSKRKETMGDSKVYGGYYTQDEIKEVVEYAASRFITVIPEIELPGHALAALAAYPELSCTGGPFEAATTWGVFPDIFCAGKEETFSFLENVLAEVIELFPSKYIHIGGDEAPKERWENCPLCQKRISNEGLKDEHELQSYFIKRIERFLNSKGKEIIGWDEILEGGLAPGATVMSWRGILGGIAAAQSGHDVIMTPTSNCYFDYYQSMPQNVPIAIGGYVPLSKVYNYEPVPDTLTAQEAKHILGVQGNVWTEYMNDEKHVEYMVFPRIAAMAEVGWTNPVKKDLYNFVDRLRVQFLRYDAAEINYSKSLFSVWAETSFDEEKISVILDLKTELDFFQIKFGKEENSASWSNYARPIFIKPGETIYFALFDGEKQLGKRNSLSLPENKAFSKEVTYNVSYSENYSGGGKFGLVDGVLGSVAHTDGTWQGFQENDFEVIINLEKETLVNKISVRFLNKILSWIFLPRYVEIYISVDGKNFDLLRRIENENSVNYGNIEIKNFTAEFDSIETRFIKIIAKNIGKNPKGHYAEGGKAWLFVDEIIVE